MIGTETRNYYEILFVSEKSTLEQIKHSYHQLALKYHPDQNKSTNAEEKFKEINEAYRILKDPSLRRAYDADLYHKRNREYEKKTTKTQETDRSSSTKQNNRPNANTRQGKKNYSLFILILFILVGLLNSGSNEINQGAQVKNTKDIPYKVLQPVPNFTQESPSIFPSTRPTGTLPLVTQPPTSAIPKEPKIDCIGPDGKHLSISQKECDDFNNAWKPSPSPRNDQPNDSNSCDRNSHSSYGSCICNDGYARNYSNGKCESCPANSTGSFGTCTCNNGFTKNYSTGECEQCPEHSSGSFGTCSCDNGYTKNYTTGKCEACPPNSTGSYGICSCNSGFVKNYSTGQCDPIK